MSCCRFSVNDHSRYVDLYASGEGHLADLGYRVPGGVVEALRADDECEMGECEHG